MENVFSPEKATSGNGRIMSQREKTVFAFVFLALSFMIVSLGFFGGMRLGLTVSLFAVFVAATVYFRGFPRITFFGAAMGIFAVLTSAVFALHTDVYGNFIAFNTVIWCSSVYLIEISGTARFFSGCWLYIIDILRVIFVNPFRYIGNAFRVTVPPLSDKSKKTAGYAIAGVVLALIFLPVIVPLLISADVAFSSLMERIFGDVGEIIAEIILSLLLFPLVMSLFFGLRSGADTPKKKPDPDDVNKLKRLEPIMFNVLLSAISVFYLIYLFSQLAYFFNAFSGILPESYDFTYADYARRGFFEMTAIAAINLFLIFVSNAFSKENGRNVYLKAVSVFICVFTEIIAATSLSKMVMYINAYGLTKLRIITSIFTVFIFLVVIFAALKIIVRRFSYMKAVILTAVILNAATALVGIDRTVAAYNTEAYFSGKLEKVDVYTISQLGDAGVPYLVRLAYAEDETVAKNARSWINGKDHLYLEKNADGSFVKKPQKFLRGYNATYEAAANAIFENSELLN